MVKMSAVKNLPNGCNIVSKQIFDKVEENQLFWMCSVVYGLIKESSFCKRFSDVFSKHSFNLVVFLWLVLTVTLAIVACLPDVKVLFYIQVVRTLFSFFIPSMICFCASALAGIVMKKRNLQYFTHICFASCVIFEAFFEILNQTGLSLFSYSLITHGLISCLFISLAGTICVHKKFHVTLYIMAAVVLFRFTLSSFKSFQNTPPIFLYIFFLSGLFMSNLTSMQIPEVVSEDIPEKGMIIPVMRQRRASSLDVRYTNKPGFVLPLNRRKSLPALGLEGRKLIMRSFLCHQKPIRDLSLHKCKQVCHSPSSPPGRQYQNTFEDCCSQKASSGSVDFSTLGEAHGMLTDLLADSSLPINVTGTLRIIVDMLSPLLQGQFHAQNYPNSLEKQKAKEDEQQVLNQPDFKEDLHLPIKLNPRYHMNVSSRRMSSSYTTTTSATGMPTIDSSTKTISIRSLSHSNIFSENERNHYTKSRSLCESPLCIINQIPDEDTFKAEIHNDFPSYYNNVDESLSDNSEVEQHLNGSIDNNRSDSNLKSKIRLESLSEYVETIDPTTEDQFVNNKDLVSSNMNGTNILPLPNSSTRRTSCDVHLEFESAASPEVDEILSNIMSWDFQIFELHEKCNVLTQVALRIFQKSNFFKTFKIPEVPFLKYFRALENGYHNIPYHNRIHAADVLHGVYYLTKHKIPGFNAHVVMNLLKEDLTLENDISDDDYGYMGDVMPELELMALYTAAAMHDFDHPGRTNAFLVTTSNPKALLYNDRSVLENHHAAAAWSLLVTNSSMNFLQELDLVDFKRFRFIVIEEILSTDLKKHFDFLTEWNAKVSGQGGGLDYTNESDRLLVGQMMIKVADIAGPSKEWSLHRKWTDRIVEEFYLQGEDEKAFDIPISSYMDRNNPQVPQLQSSFIKHLVSPLYAAYEKAGIMPGDWIDSDVDTISDSEEESSKSSVKKKVAFSVVIDNIQKNHERWLKIISEEEEDSCVKNSQQNENIYELNDENDSANEESYVTTNLHSLNNILIETANESS